MEYVTYILIILGIIALCFLLFRETSRVGRRVSRGQSMANSSTGIKIEAEAGGKPELVALNGNIPIPWGWPGNDGRVNADTDHPVSDSLHRFVDHLISEKQTIKNSEYRLRRDESLRAMVEDRFGHRTPVKSHRDGLRENSSQESKFIPGHAVKSGLADVRRPWGW